MPWNTNERWGWPARVMHWLIALLLFIQIGIAFVMDEVPEHLERYYLGWHASVGASILAVMIVRLVWASMNISPQQPATSPYWQHLAARSVHWALYLVTFATVIAGWALIGTERDPVTVELFGFIPLPHLAQPNSPYHDLLGEVHETLAFTLMALIIVHVAAALYHHVVLRDDVLRRMTSGATRTTS